MEDGLAKPVNGATPTTAAVPDANAAFNHPHPEQTMNVFLVVAALLAVCVYPEAADMEHTPATRVFLALTFGLSMLLLVVGATLLGDEHRHVALYKSTCYIFISMVCCGSVAYILLARGHHEEERDGASDAVAGIVAGLVGISVLTVFWVRLRNLNVIP